MKYSTVILLFLLFLFHVPFLDADPDHDLSFSRDALTDEGLYTAQARNFVNGAPFNLSESDAAVKTPLFTLYALAVFKVFTPSLLTIRCSVLVFSLLLFFIAFRYDFKLLLIFGLSTLTLYTNFFYQHLALAEFMSASLLILVFYFLTSCTKGDFSYKKLVVVTALISISWFLKFQYLYMIAWPALFIIMIGLYRISLGSIRINWMINRLLQYVFLSFIFVLLFLLIWYLPNKNLFNYVIFNQTETLFGEGEWFQKMIDFNFEHFFMNTKTKYFTLLFFFSVLVSPVVAYKLRKNSLFIYQLLGALSWCIIEIYKPAMVYLPSRYLVVTFLAMGLFSSVVLKGIYLLNIQNVFRFIFPALILIIPVYVNTKYLVESYINRQYFLKQANEYVRANTTQGCVIVGPWAASVSWDARLIAIPVWKDYFNDHRILEKFNPCAIVSELNEEDSGEAFSNDNIHFEKISVSKYQFSIRDWHPCIYILK